MRAHVSLHDECRPGRRRRPPTHDKYAPHAVPRESERGVFVTVRKTVSDAAAVSLSLSLSLFVCPLLSASRRARNDGFNLNILAVVPIAVAGGRPIAVAGRRDEGTEAKVAVAR